MNRIKQARLVLIRATSRGRRLKRPQRSIFGLARCERGAVMVATIFMALFLIAMLYMVIGLGRTLVMKEGMQDAADAAAYSSAIFNARGMNLIVFINLVMAALISVLIAIRVAQSFLVFIAGVLAAMAAASLGTAAAMTGPLAVLVGQQAVQMGNNYENAKKVIEPILTVLHNAQVATSVVVPFVSMTRGMVEAATHHEPAEGAFAIPGSFVLPVESDDYSRLCDEGAKFIVDLAFAAFPEPVQPLGDYVGEAAGGIAQTTSKFLCGDGGGQAPVYNQTVDRQIPRHPDEDECEEIDSAECIEMQRFMEKARPLEGTGDCREECDYDGPYELMARRARLDCVPTPPFLRENYVWHERMVEADFTYNGIVWLEVDRRPGPLFLKGEDGDEATGDDIDGTPCGVGGTVNDSEWNTDSGFRGPDEPRPVCAEEPAELRETAEVGATKTVEFREVVRVFSCTERTTRQIELASGDQAIGGSGSESRSPHKLEEDIDLGQEPFQIRAIAFGAKPDPGDAKQGVVLVNRGEGSWQDRWEGARPAGEGAVGYMIELASNVGRFSLAQAEFYFDTSAGEEGDVLEEDWMWQMKWTARLRHFHLPTDEEKQQTNDRNQAASSRVSQFGGIDPGASTESACEAAGGDDCEAGVDAVSDLEGIVRH